MAKNHQQDLMNAAALGAAITGHEKFNDWYEPDDWEGWVGLMDHITTLAERLTKAMAILDTDDAKADDFDWYLTIDNVADALVATEEFDCLPEDLSPYLHFWTPTTTQSLPF